MERMFIIPQRCCYGGNNLSIPGILFIFYLLTSSLSKQIQFYWGQHQVQREVIVNIYTYEQECCIPSTQHLRDKCDSEVGKLGHRL